MKKKDKNFVLFIGSGRSGSTIVASILNSHPNVLISHEIGIIKKGYNSEKLIIDNIISHTKKKSLNYKSINKDIKNKDINIPKKEIFLYGDKHSDQNTLSIAKNIELFNQFKSNVYNLKLINVVRNPYDNITTKYLRKQSMFDKKKGFIGAIKQYNIEMNTVKLLSLNNPLFNIRLENLILNPIENISKMFDFFSLDYNMEMIEKITNIILKKPSISRNKINWKQNQIDMVKNIIDKYEWLNGYEYEK